MQSLASILPWIQVILSILLAAVILTQQTDAALGSAFGSSGGENINRTRRGGELFMFRLTIVLAFLFTIAALATLLIA